MSHNTGTPPPLMSIAETAQYLGLSTRGIRLMIADGRLKSYTLGPRVVRLRRDEVDAALTPSDA